MAGDRARHPTTVIRARCPSVARFPFTNPKEAIMNRRTLLAMLATALVALLATVSAPSRAAAQCCTYTVSVSGSYPAACTQFKLLTRWGTGATAVTSSVGITGTGGTFPVPYPCPQQSLPFVWASFNGITTYPLGFSGPVVINGCTRNVTIQLDSNGCILILIS
jgi:hypothetical protein